MGIDIGSLFSGIKDQVEQGMNDVSKTVGNSALGYLEQQGINILQADQAQHNEQAQAQVSNMLGRPGSPFGAYVSNILQGPVLKQYGPMILVGVAVIAGMTIFLKGK